MCVFLCWNLAVASIFLYNFVLLFHGKIYKFKSTEFLYHTICTECDVLCKPYMYHRSHIPMMNAMKSKSSGLIFDDSMILRDVNLFSNYKWMQCFVLFCCNIIKSWPDIWTMLYLFGSCWLMGCDRLSRWI